MKKINRMVLLLLVTSILVSSSNFSLSELIFSSKSNGQDDGLDEMVLIDEDIATQSPDLQETPGSEDEVIYDDRSNLPGSENEPYEEEPLISKPDQNEETIKDPIEEAKAREEAEARAIEEAKAKAEAEAKAIEEAKAKAEVYLESLNKAKYVISWQMDSGGWAKDNAQLYKRMWNGKESKAGGAGLEVATIDNDATVPELRFLIREYNRTQETFILESIYKGIDFLIEMQYTSGAYPQHYPLIKNSSVPYYDYATFNDNATVMVLGFFRDIKYNKQRYGFLDEAYHKKIDNALNKGIEFILKSQIEANGVLTAWCAQHDPFTYEPKPGRSYELVSISGLESVGITDFLISLKSNDPRIVKSIQSAKQWFKEVAVYDMAFYMNGKDGKYFIPTKNQIIWYRFYEIGTNKGFFANRDGSKVYDIMEVKAERRHNYLWAGSWAKHLLE